MTRDELQASIKNRLEELGISAAEASQRAVGNPYLIANIGRDRYGLPRVDSLDDLARVLGYELYFGPPRDPLRRAFDNLDNASRQRWILKEYARIPVLDASLSAGAGRVNETEEQAAELAFRHDFLHRLGVSSASLVIAKAAGDSMTPTIQDGDLVLIDHSRTSPPRRVRDRKDKRLPAIFALVEDGEARVKRIDRADTDHLLLISDNKFYPTERKPLSAIDIIGRVAWWGHANKE